MLWKRNWLGSALFAVGLMCLVGCAGGRDYVSGKPEGYDAVSRAVRNNAKTIAGRRYYKDMKNVFKGDLEDVARSCSSQNPEPRGATIFYRLGAEGTPVETMLYPASEFSDCFLEGLRDFKLPVPPEPDYWIAIEVASWRDSRL